MKPSIVNGRIEVRYKNNNGTYLIMCACEHCSYDFLISEEKAKALQRYANTPDTIGRVIRLVVADDDRVIGFGDPIYDRFILTDEKYNTMEMPEESFFRPLKQEEIEKITS